MSADSQDPAHDHAEEIAHVHEHFRENNRWFLLCFLPVIICTVVAFNINFGPWNGLVTWLLAAIRSACIAWFLASLFKNFSLVFRTLFFSFIFLLGMIFLSLWDSEIVNKQGHGIGDPIWDRAHPQSMQ